METDRAKFAKNHQSTSFALDFFSMIDAPKKLYGYQNLAVYIVIFLTENEKLTKQYLKLMKLLLKTIFYLVQT